MRRSFVFLAVAFVGIAQAIATSDCGGKLDTDASVVEDAPVDQFVDGPYEGQCCNIHSGPTAEPCDHDANDFGIGGSLADSDVYFCGHDEYSFNGTPGSDWRHCAYQTGHAWLCCVPADPSCCPKIAEPDDAGDPPLAPGACNGFGPAGDL